MARNTQTSSRNTFAIPVEYEIADGTITATLTEATTTMVTVASPNKYVHGEVKINVSKNCSVENGVTTCIDACTAGLTGTTVLASVLGPAVAVSRYSESPARFNLTMKPFMADFTFENADWDTAIPPAINAAETVPPPAPWGYVNYPPDSPRGWQIETIGLRYSQLSIKAYGLPSSMSDGDKSLIKLWKYHNGVASDITTGFDENSIKGVTYDTSLFTLVAPLGMFDKQGPITDLLLPQGAVHISTSAPLRFSAVDLSSNSYAVAGLATTYYLIDTAPMPGCFAVQADTNAPKGTCANSVYSVPFTLGEGSYTVYALSVDKLGNYGGSISSGVYVDGTAPETNISAGGAVLAAGATGYITAADSVTITAQDVLSNGVASGIAATYMLIDITPEECDYAEGLGGINGLGSCENPNYPGPFTLPEGEHVIYYGAVDKVGNRGVEKSASITVTGLSQNLDTMPPTITASINGQIIADSATVTITSTDTIALNAEDSGSGLLGRYYTIDIEFSTTTATIYTVPFVLEPGTHTVYYSAIDNAGNIATAKHLFVNVERSKYPDIAQWPYFEYLGGFGANGTGPGYFKNLRGLNFDPGGNMWAADSTNSKIEVFGPGGEYLRTFTAGLIAVENFSICPDGTFWALSQITNGFYPALKKFSADGALVREINILGSQQFRVYPRFVACDMGNKPFVVGNTTADSDVVSFDASGNYKSKFPANIPYGNYQGLALDANGDVLILDYSATPNLKIKKFSQAGALLASMPLVSSSAHSMSVDSYGNIYVPNRSYSSVEIYSSTGGLIGTFGDLPIGRQMMPMGQPRYAGVHPYSGRLYIGGTTEIKIYGPDHTPPQYTPSILSPGSGAVVYTTSPVIPGSADAVSQIAAYEGAMLVGKTQADKYGDFSYNQAGLDAGRHLLRFQSSDAAGNLSLFSPELDITIKSMNSVQFSTPVWGPGSSEVGYSIVDTSATALGDFDRDGKTDVLGFSRNARYSFYKGNGDGTFKYVFTAQIPGMANQYSGGDDALSGDFNNDGFLDVAASVYSPNYPYSGSTLVIIYGNGDGTFQTPVTIDHLLGYAGIAKGDYNKDGYLDLASASGNSIKIYLGDPASLFLSISTSIPAELPPSSGGGITMSDIDGDGKADIVFRNAVLFGDGFNGFDAKVILPYSYTYTADVRKALASDFNQDGRKDVFLIAVDEALSFLNLGNRTFKKVQRTQTGGVYFYSGASADFNGDGVADIAVSPYRLQNVYVLAGHGDGTFTAPMALPTGGYSQYGHLSGTLLAEDINGDGRNDIFQASSELGLAGGQEINTFFSFLNKTAAPDLIPPAVVSISAENTEAGEVAVFWTATGDDGNTGRAVRYDLRYKTTLISSDIDFSAAQSISGVASPRTSGSAERFTLSTLAGGTSYYFALKTYDEAGNASALSNSPGIFTKYVVKATNTINGNPEISMISPVQPYITQISTVSGPGAVAIGSAAVQSLIMASNMYEIKPEGIYEPPATLTFYYSTAALVGIGLTEADAAVYEYFSGTGWERLPGQVLDTLNHRITVPLTRIASLFGVFGVVKDKTAPVSEFLVTGSSWTILGAGLYINAKSSISLSAFDPVVYGTSSGVAFTEFRVDAATTASFALYSAPFILSTGPHKVEFHSSDNAGNIEAIKIENIFVDDTAPSSGYAVAGSSFISGGVLYAAIGSTITLTSSDTASGVKVLFYGVNGSTYSVSSGTVAIALSTGGAYAINYYAADNVDNNGVESSVSVYVDTTAPVSALSLVGSLGRGGWHLSGIDTKITASDDSSGIRDIFYSLDESSFTSYISSFSVLSEGTHTIKTYSVDNVLNNESVRSSAFGIDISTPLVGYSYLPAANGDGWNNTPVDVVFAGTDAVSGIEYCSSSFTITGEGIGLPVSGYCADYAGWTSTVSFNVNIDTTAPVSSADIEAIQGLNGWLLSPAGITLISTDSLSGTAGLYYSLDGSSFTLYSSSFAASGEGSHLLKYYSVDRAGNKEIEKDMALKLDLNAPQVGAVSGPVANNYGWNNTAVAVVFSGTDTMSGLAYCEPEKIVDAEGSSRTITGYCSDYAGWSSTATLTVSIDTTAPNLSYIADPASNEAGWNNSEVALKFTCADSLSGVKSCPADIMLAVEGVNISTSGMAYDYAGNSRNILVSGVNIDKTAPLSTAAVSGIYRNGWYSSPVTVVLASTDPASGIKNVLYSLDGTAYTAYMQPIVVSSEGNHALSFYAEDMAGNKEPSKAIAFAIDTTAPMMDHLLDPPANAGGWNSSSVNVVFRGSDTLSGIVECSSVTVAGEGKDQKVSGWCHDLAGNIAYSTATLNTDLAQPLISAAQVPIRNTYGWNNTPVEISFTGTDALSGIAYCEPEKTASVSGASQTVTGYCMDYAGLSSTATYIVSIDTAAPLLAFTKTPANPDGWNNSDVTISFECLDDLSGIAGCPGSIMHSAEGLNISTSVRAWDLAGNYLDSAVSGINIDKSQPASTATLSGTSRNGWYSTAVEVILRSTDTLSGVRETYYSLDGGAYTGYQQPLSVNGEGPHEVKYYAVDKAGNIEGEGKVGFRIDTQAPAIGYVPDPAANSADWNNSAVSVVFTGTDSVSGVEECSSGNLSGEGAGQKIAGWCRDFAGNTGYSTATVNIDLTKPVTLASQVPGPNLNGWNKEPVTVRFAGTDMLSGAAYCTPEKLLSAEGAGQEVSGYCIDYAGNSSSTTLILNIDRTSPVITISSPAAGQIFIATRGRIYFGFSAQDNLDPAPKASALLTQLEDKGSPRGGRPAVIAVTYGQSIEPLDIDDGIWRLTVSATDFADNTNTLSGGAFEVIHDVLAPRTTQTIAGGVSLAAGVTTYITGDTVLKLSSVDDLVSAEDGIGLGVKKQAIKLKAEGTIVREILFENPEPKQGTVFASTFTASGWGLADGLYSLAYRAEDALGNIETEKSFAIGLDNTAPVTSAELAGTPGENGWHVSAVTVKLAATDALSGVEGIYYQLEFNDQKSEPRSYTAPFTVNTEGLYKVYFYAKDKLGNTEAEKSIAFKIDFTNPLISAERTPLANAYGWNNTTVTVNYLCTDGLSGVKSCPPDAIIVNEGFAQSASGEVQDHAGNRSSASVSGINIDKTVPVSAYRVEGTIYNAGDGKTYLSPMSKLSLSAADPVSGGTGSGIDAMEYHIDSGAFEVYTSSFGLSAGIRTVYYRSRDKAGNEEPTSSAVFPVDGASPVTSFNISAPPYIVDGTHYVTSQSVLSFAAADPLTAGLASGVLITKYRLDGGAWQVYTASISITSEGLHKLDYYSIDNVQNTEVLRTLTIIVDNTAPLTTISVGEPKFEVFGLKIITPETPVTLSASDPDAAGPASGVKSIYYELTDTAGWSSGTLNYTEPFTTGRQGTYTVRYWSADNAGNTGTPLEAKLRVSSLRSDALDAVDGLELTGSADIAGTVRSNTTVSLAGNTRILGDVYASTISLSGKSLVTGQQHSGAATLIPVPLELADIVDIASNTNNNSLIPAKYIVDGRLVVPAKDMVTLSTGIYYFNGIDLGGGAKVSVNGKVDMLVAGDISINGGASLNAAGGSSLLNIFLSTESALTFTGGGSLAAYVYAPYSQLKLAGNALLGGHYLVKRAIISGAGNIIQAGETLPQAASATGDTGGKKKASALAVSGAYNVLAGPDPAFRLGEVYVFPNPAKGGEAPVFHIETGIADSVNIKIYTVSGRAAHEYTLTGLPAELDDGNGLSYAYEYTWRGHIPSGVYLYYIEAQKAGQKLKKTGKFAIVR